MREEMEEYEPDISQMSASEILFLRPKRRVLKEIPVQQTVLKVPRYTAKEKREIEARLREALLPEIVKIEGDINHMYVDSLGKLTCGVGTLTEREADYYKHPWMCGKNLDERIRSKDPVGYEKFLEDKEALRIPGDDSWQDVLKVKDAVRGQNMAAGSQYLFQAIGELPPGWGRQMAADHLEKNIGLWAKEVERLNKMPETGREVSFYHLPLGAMMMYAARKENMGGKMGLGYERKGKNSRVFPKFTRAMVTEDFEAMAREGKPYNAFNENAETFQKEMAEEALKGVRFVPVYEAVNPSDFLKEREREKVCRSVLSLFKRR